MTKRSTRIKKSKQERFGSNRNGSGSIGADAWRPDKLCIATGHEGVKRCLDFLARNYQRPIKLADLLEMSGTSRRGFIEAFIAQTGLVPAAYLRWIRVECAKRLLMENDVPLREIAPRCGYQNVMTFSSDFRRQVRQAPKQFQMHYWRTLCRSHLTTVPNDAN